MKRILSILLFSACFVSAAIAGEISYFNKSWDEIKAKAKAEHKYIFIDCYTDWCGWCKVMDKETMPDAGIVATMNEKFVAVKMDMEHGEGKEMAMKYHIMGYPTFMFFNPEGEFVYLSVGYQKPKAFTEELNNSLDKNKQIKAPGFSKAIDVNFPEFYKLAFAENGKKKFPEEKEVNAFLDGQKDLFSEVSWGVLARFNTNEKYTKFFFGNIKKYEQLYGSTVDDKINNLVENKLEAAIKNADTSGLQEVLKMIDKYVKTDAGEMKMNCRLAYYKATKDCIKYGEAVNDFIAQKGYEAIEQINEYCWGIYQDCDDAKLLTQACSWMDKAVSKEPKYAYMDTYASLLYKSGQLKEAKAWAEKAIAEGKKSGNDTSPTEALLKKMEDGK